MTGYAAITRETAGGTLTIELKSVNSRFLDLQFRMNDDLRAVEPMLREAIMTKVVRGKVECRVSFGRKSAEGANQSLNLQVLDAVADLQQQIRYRFTDAAPLSVSELLRWPGVVEEAQLAHESLHADMATTMQEAIDAFADSRAREGQALQVMLEQRIDDLESIVTKLTPMIPQIVAQFQEKATERMQVALSLALMGAGAATRTSAAEMTGSRDDALDRIRQEVTLYGIRIDIGEELTRLAAHLSETRRLLQLGGQLGKRLDFMMQELNREANTVGSKAAVKDLADASMAMKLLIEQMREQVQNLE